MKCESKPDDEVALQLSEYELRIIMNAMREICFAVEGFEFRAKLGCSEEQAVKISKDLKQAMDEANIDL